MPREKSGHNTKQLERNIKIDNVAIIIPQSLDKKLLILVLRMLRNTAIMLQKKQK